MSEAKLSSPVTLKNRALWFGKIELQEDQIVISGWRWTGPVKETIPIADINSFEKWTVLKGQNFRLNRDGDPDGQQSPLRGRIEKKIGLWALELEKKGVEVKMRH